MASEQMTFIDTRLGQREVRLDKVVFFPRGIIGFEHMRSFTLLQIRADAALLLLQSMEDPSLGLIVTDPFVFIPDYNLHVNDADQHLLQADNAGDLAVLVTATIPPGKPEETALNLLGPILINHRSRLGLQVPQPEGNCPARYFIHKTGS
ncbi:flagellar assembly protein FliW [Desulfovibrio sp. OttesenSCG-928-A18]|nr:flagellar assembly protein FliW [Desulfovibrio sp. OttesenSCG-928-A18]